MSRIEVGDAPVKYVNTRSIEKCPKCGAFLIDRVPVYKKGQPRYEASKGRRFKVSTFCTRCNYRR